MEPVLGPEGSAALHSSLARHCIRRMHAAGLSRHLRTEVHATGASSRDVRRWIGRDVRVREQVAGDRELQFELTRRRRLPLDDYTRTLVEGVAARRPAIDALLGEVADRWQVQRMPARPLL